MHNKKQKKRLLKIGMETKKQRKLKWLRRTSLVGRKRPLCYTECEKAGKRYRTICEG